MKEEHLRRRLFLPGSQLELAQIPHLINQMQHQELAVEILSHQVSLKVYLEEIRNEGRVAAGLLLSAHE